MESDKTQTKNFNDCLTFPRCQQKCNVDNPSMLAKTKLANLENIRKET